MPTTLHHRPHHLAWLTEITQLPTAAGREWRVADWIRRWVRERPQLHLTDDAAGNLIVSFRNGAPPDPGLAGGEPRHQKPLFITAHLDHPAFVLERIVGPGTAELSFRGGVMDVFFENAPVALFTRDDRRIRGTLTGALPSAPGAPFKHYLAEFDTTDGAAVGDVAAWDLPAAEVIDGNLHTPACDDLAAVAAALCAMDLLREKAAAGEPVTHTSLLFTRSEEIGFIGAIGACKLGTMPRDARVVALENSRAFDDSPVGGGPIVRVGDRMSIFDPRLTAACARRAEETFKRPAQPIASQTAADIAKSETRPWQRKLMAGGACEASVFCAYGYQATCLCLPLGNYHNMPHLAELQAGTYDRDKLGPPRAAREFISLADFHGLVDLLVAIAEKLPSEDPVTERFEKLYADRRFVLEGEGVRPANV